MDINADRAGYILESVFLISEGDQLAAIYFIW